MEVRKIMGCVNSYYNKGKDEVIEGINIVSYECSIDIEDIELDEFDRFDLLKRIEKILNGGLIIDDDNRLNGCVFKDDMIFLVYVNNYGDLREIINIKIGLIG